MKDKTELVYIDFSDFVKLSGKKENTVKKNHAKIPGIEKVGKEFRVLSGTRYPCDLHRYKINNSADRRYILLKTISEYKYISHKDLRLEELQFHNMLNELLEAGLICKNGLCNGFGANAYDCTPAGDKVLMKAKHEAIAEITLLVAEATGKFIGAALL